MTCLPLLSRLEEGKRPDDHEPQQHPAIKEEIMSGGATGGMWQSGVDLNIGLPFGDEEDDHQEEEDVDGDEEEEREEWKQHMQGGCKAEGEEELEAAAASIEGSSKIIVGEFGAEAGGMAMGWQYWIPTPAQILIGAVQFVCHVCNKTFNRYNNMQVNARDVIFVSSSS
jgi:hypothetical protein